MSNKSPVEVIAERNAAYRSSLCVELCGRKYSPGRTRCEGCHAVYVAGLGQEGDAN